MEQPEYDNLPKHLQLRVDDYVKACHKIFNACHNPTEDHGIWGVVAKKLAEDNLFVSLT